MGLASGGTGSGQDGKGWSRRARQGVDLGSAKGSRVPAEMGRLSLKNRRANLLRCSSCGKRRKQMKHFGADPGIHLCDRCIERLDAMLRKVADQTDTDRGRRRSMTDSTGLRESLSSFTDEEGRDSGIRFHHGADEVELPTPMALLMFHIAREGVMNAIKHAEPTDIWIDIAEDLSGDVVLRVRDNGTGFDVNAPVRDRYGIRMMHERANVGGGTFSITSSRGEGTMITVRFPSPRR